MGHLEFLAFLVLLSCNPGLTEHENFCKPLEDYGPRQDVMDERTVCRTEMKKECQPITETGCLNVTEISCEVMLTTDCSMNWTNRDSLESVMTVKETYLKNCTKEMVVEFHNKTVYDCKNVTKVHCTTLWTIDDEGQKVWAGNEDDCKDVTWEECYPVVKQVPMSVARMNCLEFPVTYFDYENITSPVMADQMDCQVEKVPVCRPITTTKCDDVTYTKCEEVPDQVCSSVEIPVPAQQQLHKQWCLFDQEENIDFDRQVKAIEQFEAEERIKLDGILGELDPIFVDYTDSAPAILVTREARANLNKKKKSNTNKNKNGTKSKRGGRPGHSWGRKKKN